MCYCRCHYRQWNSSCVTAEVTTASEIVHVLPLCYHSQWNSSCVTIHVSCHHSQVNSLCVTTDVTTVNSIFHVSLLTSPHSIELNSSCVTADVTTVSKIIIMIIFLECYTKVTLGTLHFAFTKTKWNIYTDRITNKILQINTINMEREKTHTHTRMHTHIHTHTHTHTHTPLVHTSLLMPPVNEIVCMSLPMSLIKIVSVITNVTVNNIVHMSMHVWFICHYQCH